MACVADRALASVNREMRATEQGRNKSNKVEQVSLQTRCANLLRRVLNWVWKVTITRRRKVIRGRADVSR